MATASQLRDEQEIVEGPSTRRSNASVPGAIRRPWTRHDSLPSRLRCGGWCSSAWASAPQAAPSRWGPIGWRRSSGWLPVAGAVPPSLVQVCARSPSTGSSALRAETHRRLRNRPHCRSPAPAASVRGSWMPPGAPAAGAGGGIGGRAGAGRWSPGRDAHRAVLAGWRSHASARPGRSKSLQDVFGDRKVPRSLRRSLPVVVSGDDIAWVAGVAVSDLFRPGQHMSATLRLRARAVSPSV